MNAIAKIFVISATGSIAGVVSNVKAVAMNDMTAVSSQTDLEALSLDQLTTIFNNATGGEAKRFKISKDKAAVKVFAALEAMPVEKLIQLDKKEEEKVKEAATVVQANNGERKVRDSKLQRMAAAFRTKDDATGDYKHWTVKELMEKCGTTEKITHQYISILRAQNDRFVMNIVKDKDAKTFQYQPKDQVRPASAAVATQAQAAA